MQVKQNKGLFLGMRLSVELSSQKAKLQAHGNAMGNGITMKIEG
jgi:hypothetical protein